MNPRQIKRFAISAWLIVLCFALTAQAETKEDEGLWLMLAGQGSLAPDNEDFHRLRWWLDLQPRFADRADGLDQALIRPGVGVSLSDNTTVWAGYAWIRTKRRGQGHSEEHRIWQQLTWSPRIGRLKLSSRTRLEQRFLDTGDDIGWRFRQFVKGTFPIAVDGRLFLSAYDEIFFDLNGTDWGQRSGVSQNRMFAGLGWKFGSRPSSGPLTVEVGYLNQFVRKRSADDELNHILSINLFVNF